MPEWDAVVDRPDFDASTRFITYRLEREIALQAWGDAAEFTQSMRLDGQLNAALELLSGIQTPAGLIEAVDAAEDRRNVPG